MSEHANTPTHNSYNHITYYYSYNKSGHLRGGGPRSCALRAKMDKKDYHYTGTGNTLDATLKLQQHWSCSNSPWIISHQKCGRILIDS
eukprot:4264209-Heterocapsa_arctica.AAC.1